jgi:nucleoside-diphosphate-sugar epimerase
MAIKKVLITGSAGYLGRSLYEYLNSKDYEVIGLVHKHRVKGQQVITGDLLNPDSFLDDISGMDAVVNCAALVGGYWSKNKYLVNSQGTFNLLNAAINQNLKKFVHISSLAVVDEFIDHHDSDEDELHPTKPKTHYITSKIQAEKYVQAKKDAINVTILRPGWLWGPSEKSIIELFQMVRNDKFAFIGSGNNLTYFTHISNILQVIERALKNDKISSGEIFNITDGVKLSMVDFINGVTSELGKPKVTKHIPIWLANTSAFFFEKLKPGGDLTRQNVAIMSKNLHFSTAKAEKMLGYRPDNDWKKNIKTILNNDLD